MNSLPALTISGGILSLPGAFPQANESVAFLSSSMVGGIPSSSMDDRGVMCSIAMSVVTMSSLEYSSGKCSAHLPI